MLTEDVELEFLECIYRIAAALERIADREPDEVKRTPFPWEKMSNRTINCIDRVRGSERDRHKEFQGKTYPLSCEDIVEIGCGNFYELKNFGVGGAIEISNELEKLGFHNWFRRYT